MLPTTVVAENWKIGRRHYVQYKNNIADNQLTKMLQNCGYRGDDVSENWYGDSIRHGD